MERTNMANNNSTDLLKGKWFHSFKSNAIHWQGKVLGLVTAPTLRSKAAKYLVQLYSWEDGCPSDQIIVSLDDMKDWKFYNPNEPMPRAASHCANEKTVRSSEERREVKKRFIEK